MTLAAQPRRWRLKKEGESLVMALDSRPGGDRAATLRLALVSTVGLLAVIAGAAWLAGFARLRSPQELSFHGPREARGAWLIPVQSKSAKDLGLGKLLVASRDLGDQNFAETAVLLVHYDEKSVVGLILNRRTDLPISRLFQAQEAAKRRADRVYAGGPVEESVVLALLRSPAALNDAERVFGDLYLITNKTRLEKAVAEGAGSSVFRLYLGYAGWTNNQLQKEVQAGAWYIFQADAEMVFDSDPDSLWPRLIRKTEEKIAGNFRGGSAESLRTAATRAALWNDGFDPPFFKSSYLAASPK
jgi:putative AlgH/UPF0301 family transcriptional regulator